MNDITEKIDNRNSVRSVSESENCIKNNMNRRIFKYWQEVVGVWFAISVGIGTLWYLFKIFGQKISSDQTMASFFSVFYPWFIYIAGVIIIFTLGISLFRTYLPVMISMNVTRQSALYQITAMLAELSTAICLIIAIIWKLEEAVTGEQIEMFSAIWVMFSILLVVSAITMAAGAVVVKWGGKILILITLIIGAAAGALAGMFTAMNFRDMDEISLHIIKIRQNFAAISVNVKWVSAGIIIFILAYFLARKLTCRLEVR